MEQSTIQRFQERRVSEETLKGDCSTSELERTAFMSAIEIDLSSPDHECLMHGVAVGGHANPSQYLQHLIRADYELRRALSVVTGNSRAEAMVIEGLESGASGEVADADWDQLRAPFRSRLGGDQPS